MEKLADKDPADVKDYHNCWASPDNDNESTDNGLLQGDTISGTNSTWVITGPDSSLTKVSDLVQDSAVKIQGITYPADTVTTIWLSGGTPGNTYTLTNKIITIGNRTLERSFQIDVKQL